MDTTGNLLLDFEKEIDNHSWIEKRPLVISLQMYPAIPQDSFLDRKNTLYKDIPDEIS